MRSHVLIFSIVTLSTGSLAAAAESTAPVSDVVVIGARDIADFVAPADSATTVTRVGRSALDAAADPASSNPLKAIQLAPSVHFESADATGTTLNQTIRIRGKSSFHLARSVEGLPLTGIVGGADLWDMENVEAVSVYRGALPANKGFGISNATGVVDLELRRPQEQAAVDASVAMGSDSYYRTFARFDTGTFGAGTSLFLSAANAEGDKWRGKGSTKRDNLTVGLKQTFSSGVGLEAFAAYNFYKQNDYRSLNYAQATNLGSFQDFDYNLQRTGSAATDINYYDYNRQQYADLAVVTKLTVPVGAHNTITVKPYYWKDDGYRLFGGNVLGGPGLTRWDIDHDLYGAVGEYAFKLGSVDFAAGYWFQSMASPPPPVYQKAYRIQANGDLTFAGWSLLSKQERHVMNSPYLNASGAVGAFSWNAGARYLRQRAPAITYFLTAGLPDTTYDNVLDRALTADVGNSVRRRTLSVWLPQIGLQYALTSEWSVHGSVGRTHGRPDWGPQSTQFANNRTAFRTAGVTLQTLFDKLDMEIDTTAELGLRYDRGSWYVAPTLFKTKAKDREVQIYDPAVNVAYYQSTTHATASGAELELGATPIKDLVLYASVAYDRQRFDEDTVVSSSNTMATRGKQVPDTPEWSAKAAASYRLGPVQLSPSVRYLSTRYADALNTQPIKGTTIADMEVGFGPWSIAGANAVRVGLSVLNAFDRRYIALISASDIQANGNTSFMPGAERAFAATINAQF